MKNLILTMALSLLTLTSGLTYANDQICSDVDMQRKIQSHSYSMAFKNFGGLADGGVCWWHSRWHRNAVYLAYFSPDKPKPDFDTKSERKSHDAEGLSIKEIIKTIKSGDRVVEIPGYRNLREFSAENAFEIQATLEAWQREDGFLNQKWVLGLFRPRTVKPEKLESQMHDLYDEIQAGNIVYQMLQLKGITAHAWLVVGMERTSNGYTLYVRDSNFPSNINRVAYQFGDSTINQWDYGKFVPHTGNRGEENGLKKARTRFCDSIN